MRQTFVTIISKAVRLENIVGVYILSSYLEKNLNIKDILTSFVLKAALYNKRRYIQDNNIKDPVEIATKTYMYLLKKLRTKKFYTDMDRYHERIVDCFQCTVESGCCKRRKLMMAMCERIIQWLQEHKDELEDIEYADDVDLLKECNIPDLNNMLEAQQSKDTDSTCNAPVLDKIHHEISSIGSVDIVADNTPDNSSTQVLNVHVQEREEVSRSSDAKSSCLLACFTCFRGRSEQRNRQEDYELN